MGGLPHRSPLSSYWPLLRTEPLSAFSFFFSFFFYPLSSSLPPPEEILGTGFTATTSGLEKKKQKKQNCCVTPAHTGTKSILGVFKAGAPA